MSKEPISRPVEVSDLRYLLHDHLPDACWTLGGALRFDASLLRLISYLSQFFPLRRPARAAGVPPCHWSLDWHEQRKPFSLQEYSLLLDRYTEAGVGLVLTFDNPFLTPGQLEDSYALRLATLLHQRRQDSSLPHALCVANDQLAGRLRQHCPRLPIHCHINRLVAEPGKRTPDLYAKLSGIYDRICLHPADATRPALFTALEQPESYDIVLNDPCLRNCPVRRDHMRLLAERRLDPYNASLAERQTGMIQRNGCQKTDAHHLHQKATCNLTRGESTALYQQGFRSFVVQSSLFRNEITLLWDIFHCMLDHSPETDNKSALIAASGMDFAGIPAQQVPSGLKGFSFSTSD